MERRGRNRPPFSPSSSSAAGKSSTASRSTGASSSTGPSRSEAGGPSGATARLPEPLGRAVPVEAEADAVGVGDVVGQQRVGDEDDGGGAAVGGRLQGDPDVLPLGEPTDHEQAEAVGVGQLELGCLGEPEVGVQQRVGRHAEAAVVDLQREAVGDPFAHDLDGGVRRGEHRGVL
jgi:hypothetical protein